MAWRCKQAWRLDDRSRSSTPILWSNWAHLADGLEELGLAHGGGRGRRGQREGGKNEVSRILVNGTVNTSANT